jgi:hypothetical protein
MAKHQGFDVPQLVKQDSRSNGRISNINTVVNILRRIAVEDSTYLIIDSVKLEAFTDGIGLRVLDGDWHWYDTIVD